MQHSIAAKYAVRSAARFVRPSSQARQRRLGLRAASTFQPASPRATVLRRADLGPIAQLRANWRAIRPARSHRITAGLPRPLVRMSWASVGQARSDRRSGAASAPWRA